MVQLHLIHTKSEYLKYCSKKREKKVKVKIPNSFLFSSSTFVLHYG